MLTYALMGESIALTSQVRINTDVVFRDLDGEFVLLNLRTGVYFGLDRLGTRIWWLIEEHCSLEAVLESLLDEYDVVEGRCKRDLLGFVADLRENELVDVGDPRGQ